MAVGKKPAEVVVKIIPGKRACDHMDFGKLQSDLINLLELAIVKDLTELIGICKIVESILIYILSERIWCLDGLHLLQEDGNKGEVNRHDNNHREELDGLNIPGDACKLTTHTDEDKENENSNKYEVILVEDEKTGSEHNAIDVIVAKLQDILTNGENTEVNMLIERLTTTKEYTIKEVGDLIEKYEVRAPKTNNILSPAYRRNRLYKASKDPIKTSGDMHRDIRINLIDHCRSVLNSGRAKFPYGVLKLYTETGHETAPGQCLFKFNDPKFLQLVYCVNDSCKPHPAYLEVLDLPILMVRTEKQNSEESPKLISLQYALSEGIVRNQVVAYFIVTIYEFYKCIGMSEKLRFKQQCDRECWVAEIECSGGWIECTRISGENAAAFEAKLDSIEVEERDLSQTSLDSAFKKNSKKVAQAIEAMSEKEKKKMMADLNSKKEHKYFVGTIQEMVTITPDMLPVTKEKNTVYVATVSSWIGRIVCCLYAHAYTTKQGKDGTLNVFSFPSLVAPYKCFVSVNDKYIQATELTKKSLEKAGIRYIAQTQGRRAWNKLIIPDECSCQFAVRVSSENLVTIRNRGSERNVGVESDRMGQVIEDVLSGVCTWKDTCEKYPCGRCFLSTCNCNRKRPNQMVVSSSHA